jgi:hypothetical protein
MVDAAGAIYVIGGRGGGGDTYYQDVWVSTDGGVDRFSLARGGWGVERRYSGVLQGYYRVLQGYEGVP